jgi:hypothetical protein
MKADVKINIINCCTFVRSQRSQAFTSVHKRSQTFTNVHKKIIHTVSSLVYKRVYISALHRAK